MKVEYVVRDGKKYYYILLGKGWHYVPTHKIWVNRELINEDEKIVFPLKNAKLFKTEKGSFVIRPFDGWYVYNIIISAGYRGEATIHRIEPEPELSIEYPIYHSERGNLGISSGILFTTNSAEVYIEFSRSGRLYGDPGNGVITVSADGQEQIVPYCSIETLKEVVE